MNILDLYFFNESFSLFFFILSPLFFCFLIFFIKRCNIYFIKNIAFLGSVIIFFFSLFFWISFENFCFSFQYTVYLNWFSFNNINYSLGIDGLSLLF